MVINLSSPSFIYAYVDIAFQYYCQNIWTANFKGLPFNEEMVQSSFEKFKLFLPL